MKPLRQFVVRALVGGVLIVVPVYLSVLLLLKAMQNGFPPRKGSLFCSC